MKKYIFIVILIYIASILATTVFTDKINAVSILVISIVQMILSVILLFLFKADGKERLRVLAGINVCFFSIYNIIQNFFILSGSRLERILENSSFINSNNISESLNSPVENTITSIAIIIILHWIVTYRLSRAKRDETV